MHSYFIIEFNIKHNEFSLFYNLSYFLYNLFKFDLKINTNNINVENEDENETEV